ncbi:hypothetical protein LELG_00262 [Lodderomyces elongisporus NRRL YB-4239]|uniref:ATPase synthesis protein 25, mitochondrial n=1 Tax=Lodderomyces elongisporus (strain ATCC 11503 / CBS 2605 / JCM 1781 / NBRC 1676 / NRRL YB-4239) TaxID=379508 RepID=ATP25_LODEL|nr:RecName: Full=ATPase synthesis protein 25, mitochondrial; Flags: Precursor [Lodderomyces elongisporus NRRL YB-4239]EDK42084.1 hypothetical protein LELG_00262 [Lodderomyces elongisporus NRRL YB-4239]
MASKALLTKTLERSSYLAARFGLRYFSTTLRFHNKQQNDDSIPWYMRSENTSQPEQIDEPLFEDLPENLPNKVKDLLTLLVAKYGLSGVKVIDLALLPTDHPKSLDRQSEEKIVVIASGKSEKHIYKASYDLKQHIKHDWGFQCAIEGMVTNSMSAVERRRLAKRARQGPPATHNEFGINPNTWVRCELPDGVIVHMMSPERREALDLELMYDESIKFNDDSNGNPYTPYNQYLSQNEKLDQSSIFYGLRREFHTSSTTKKTKTTTTTTTTSSSSPSSPQQQSKSTTLDSVYNDFLQEHGDASADVYKARFDKEFSGNTIDDFNRKFLFYKLLHLKSPTTTSLEDVTSTLLDKYSAVNIISQSDDWNLEIVQDVIKYLELLIDTPVTSIDSSTKLNLLSDFIGKVAMFATDDIHLFAIDKFQVLLWALTTNKVCPITAAHVNSIIESKGQTLRVGGSVASIANTPAGNTTANASVATNSLDTRIIENTQGARDVRELLRSVNYDKRGKMPLWLREQMLFTYAQSRNWVYFWKEWRAITQSLQSPSDFINYFVKTLVLLVMVNDKTALKELLSTYWHRVDDGVCFISEFEKNGKQFEDNNQRLALKTALLLLDEAYPGDLIFRNAQNFASSNL